MLLCPLYLSRPELLMMLLLMVVMLVLPMSSKLHTLLWYMDYESSWICTILEQGL